MADHDYHRWSGHATSGPSVFSIPPHSRLISRAGILWNEIVKSFVDKLSRIVTNQMLLWEMFQELATV